MQEENISRAIIVVQQGMTPSAKQVSVCLHEHVDFDNADLRLKVQDSLTNLYGCKSGT